MSAAGLGSLSVKAFPLIGLRMLHQMYVECSKADARLINLDASFNCMAKLMVFKGTIWVPINM